MDRQMKEALDRHITGNYGADQFPDDDESSEEGPVVEQVNREDNDCYNCGQNPCHPQCVRRWRTERGRE